MNEESAEGFSKALEKEKELYNPLKKNIVPTFAKPVESKNNSSNVSTHPL